MKSRTKRSRWQKKRFRRQAKRQIQESLDRQAAEVAEDLQELRRMEEDIFSDGNCWEDWWI